MRVLFITGTRIGDAILTFGALEGVIATRMADEVWVACGPAPAPLAARVPGVTRVIAMEKRRFGLHWVDLWRRCVAKRWDVVIDMRRSLLAFGLRAGERRVSPKPQKGFHRVEHAGAVAGIRPGPPPRLTASHEDRAALRAHLPALERAHLVLAPTANWAGKVWPADRFADLALRLTRPGGALEGAPVILVGGPGEEAESARVAGLLDAATDLTGRLNLPEALALMEEAALVVANDSGLMHLAAAAGAPTLGLFGPTDEGVYGPFGARAAAVRGATPAARAARANGDPVAGPALMAELSVDAALRMAESMTRTGRRR